MTSEEIIAAVRECAEKLGHAPSNVELMKYTGVSRKAIRRHFGNYRVLLAECNLAGTGCGYKASMEELFRDWVGVARKLKKLPTMAEYDLQSEYSVRPLVTRFGAWSEVPRGLKQYAEEQGWTEKCQDVLAMVDQREKQAKAIKALRSAPGPESAKKARRFAVRNGTDNPNLGPGNAKATEGREVFGGLMRPGPMVCAPTNEQGVLFLFGAMAVELGFAVLKLGTAYPDCLAFRVVDGERLELKRIEFEYESRNFLRHMHEASRCDVIVCWRHNWEDCPVEVIELSKWQKL